LVLAGGSRILAFATDMTRPEGVGQAVQVTIAQDEPGDQLANRLAAAGLIQSTMLFEGQLRFGGVELKPGTYTLRKGMSSPQIVARITGAAPEETPVPVEAPRSFSITVPEGWRIEQIAEEYAANDGDGGFDAFMAAVAAVDRSQYDFLADVPADLPLEGYLFPDTYTFSATDPERNVAAMLANFDNKYDQEMRNRTAEMGLSLHQVVTLASLVEKEAAVADERPIIADVYISRWEQEWRLEADPTVQYVLGQSGDWWPELSGEDLFADSPYNMYQNDGLPPGPIANPGLGAIQGVLYPENTNYMFFVAKQDDSGTHAFAVTKEEQDANVAEYLGDGS
ncbi:MAG: endolytic transglycosylase MltG, partial [Chloroflexia bacterium]|nr:endolytic transglycosylase MltG [Chloroflexia bacterium]